MLLTNHTLTGILLGLSIDNPVLLAPTAVASHLVLDMTPHFWFKKAPDHKGFHDPKFLVFGSVDFVLSAGITVAACVARPDRALTIIIGAVGAALPDLTYIPIIIFGKARIEHWLPFYRPMIAFLAKIQWYEKPPGLITEVAWTSLMIWLLHFSW